MKQNWSFISKSFNTDVSTSDNREKESTHPNMGVGFCVSHAFCAFVITIDQTPVSLKLHLRRLPRNLNRLVVKVHRTKSHREGKAIGRHEDCTRQLNHVFYYKR